MGGLWLPIFVLYTSFPFPRSSLTRPVVLYVGQFRLDISSVSP